MDNVKWVWKKQDIFNKIIFLSGIALFIYGLTQKAGLYSGRRASGVKKGIRKIH